MQPLVQSALDAANRGENKKALEFCKQALAANPNDVDAWLVVAALVEQPERKRQCLNRVLALDPTNAIARDELLEMDRAAMGGTPALSPEPAPVSPPAYSSAPPPPTYPTSASAFESDSVSDSAYPSPYSGEYPANPSDFEPAPVPSRPPPVPSQIQEKAPSKASPKTRLEKPLVFKYPLLWRISIYFFVGLFACVGLLVATMDVVSSLPLMGLAFLIGVAAMIFFPKVEITETGIRISGTFSRSGASWSDIKSIKPSVMKHRLELLKSNGEVIKVSSQVSGYPRIVELLRQKRPDLFGMTSPPAPKE